MQLDRGFTPHRPRLEQHGQEREPQALLALEPLPAGQEQMARDGPFEQQLVGCRLKHNCSECRRSGIGRGCKTTLLMKLFKSRSHIIGNNGNAPFRLLNVVKQ